MVPLQAAELAAAELRHAVKELGHRAVQIGARIEEEGLDTPALDPFWKAARGTQRAGHRASGGPRGAAAACAGCSCTSSSAIPSETTFAAAALLLGGVFDRFPQLRVLLVHGGGCVPYQFGRIDRGRVAAPPFARGPVKKSLDGYAGNLYYDTVLHDDEALNYLIRRVGADHVALGSDYPFPLRDADPVQTVHRISRIDVTTRSAPICWDTGAALLGLVNPLEEKTMNTTYRGLNAQAGRPALLLAFTAARRSAQNYPAGPVRIVVPFPAGGGVERHGAAADAETLRRRSASRSSSTTAPAPTA